MSRSETGANQYGFYAVPKALEPKKKYREEEAEEYQDQEIQQDSNEFAEISNREAENQRLLQRDYYVDEAPYPQFKPKERGLDYGVQIQHGDLFDYELQVRPLVQILVGRSVVSALNQLQEEKEKEDREKNLDKYQKKRNAELMVTQRLEAKHKRKDQEAQRRRLQKEVYLKNQKQAGKKIIARKNAKACLLGLKEELYNQLEDAGYLRSTVENDLKINYEEWLYSQIMSSLEFQKETQRLAERIIREEEHKKSRQHQKFIKAEQERRQEILDERERIKQENQKRKEKKRIKKLKIKLNSEREPNMIKFEELMQKYDQVQNILRFSERTNGFVRQNHNKLSIHIAGGLQNYILALLSNSERAWSVEEIENILIKILREGEKGLEFELSKGHHQKLEQVKRKMNEDQVQFMKNKQHHIKLLLESISLDLSILEATNTHIKSDLHLHFIEALLNIHLTVQPENSQENSYQLTDKQKKLLEFSEKITFLKQNESLFEQLQQTKQILRIHFERLQKEEEQQKQKSEDEWINIYDGEQWTRICNQRVSECNKEEQNAASYSLNSFESAFVYDERTLFYLQRQLSKLLEIQNNEKMNSYSHHLSHLKAKLEHQRPVYDVEIKWEK